MRTYKEECSLLVAVTTDSGVVEGVPCKVYIPQRGNKPVFVELYCSPEQYKAVIGSYKVSIAGEESGRYVGVYKVSASVLLKKGESRKIVRGEEVKEYAVRYEAWDLRYTTYWHTMNASLQGENKCRFHLTPSIHSLQPHSTVLPYPTGEVSSEVTHALSVTLSNGVDITFKPYYTWEHGKSTLTLFYELVAECVVTETGAFPAAIERTLEQLRDVLLLASFASRDWCFCYKWTASHAEGTTTAFIKTIVPQKGKIPNYEDALILLDNGRTVKKHYSSFAANTYKRHIAVAIHYLLPNKHLSIDIRFVQLFMAVEALAKKCVPRHARPQPERGKKIKLSDYVNSFCAYYNVVLSDLWEMFGPKGSLYSIRNRLAHGDIINSADYPPVMTAEQHLQWSVERMIIGVLGWDVSTTRVDPVSMAKAELKDGEWRKARAVLL